MKTCRRKGGKGRLSLQHAQLVIAGGRIDDLRIQPEKPVVEISKQLVSPILLRRKSNRITIHYRKSDHVV